MTVRVASRVRSLITVALTAIALAGCGLALACPVESGPRLGPLDPGLGPLEGDLRAVDPHLLVLEDSRHASEGISLSYSQF